ncbi:MAG: hypothetical protein K6B65_06115 [Bacilli bacterium]|nr:hypothetical protein [Bacilli bacterium]
MRNNGKTYASEIVQVSPWKAFTGFAVDFFLSFTVMMVLTFFVSPYLQEAMGAGESQRNMEKLLTDSSLFQVTSTSSSLEWNYYFYGSGYAKQLDSNGKIKDTYNGKDNDYVGHYPFELYTEIVFSYYSSFCFEEGNEFVNLDGSFNKDLGGLSEQERGKWIGENIFKINGDSSSYFAFDVDNENNPKYDAKPVLNLQNPVVSTLFDEKTAAVAASKLNAFFVSGSPKYDGVYELSCSNLETYQPRFVELKKQANRIVFLSKIPIRLVPPVIFFLIVPLLVRDGKSVGRLLANTAVIDYGGYSAKKWRILLHQGILYLPWLLSILPYDILAVISVALVYTAEFLVSNVSPSKRGVHEMMAGTMTVNDAESSYFSSKEEYESYVRENPESVAEEEETEPVVEEEPVVLDSKILETEEGQPQKEETSDLKSGNEENEMESTDYDEDDFVDKK